MAAHVCPQTRTVGLSAITIIGIVPKIINYMSPFEDRWRQEDMHMHRHCIYADIVFIDYQVPNILTARNCYFPHNIHHWMNDSRLMIIRIQKQPDEFASIFPAPILFFGY